MTNVKFWLVVDDEHEPIYPVDSSDAIYFTSHADAMEAAYKAAEDNPGTDYYVMEATNHVAADVRAPTATDL